MPAKCCPAPCTFKARAEGLAQLKPAQAASCVWCPHGRQRTDPAAFIAVDDLSLYYGHAGTAALALKYKTFRRKTYLPKACHFHVQMPGSLNTNAKQCFCLEIAFAKVFLLPLLLSMFFDETPCSHPSFGVKCQSQSKSTRLSYFPISGTVCNHHSTHLDLSPFTDLAQNATMASSPFATAGFSAAVHCLVQQRLCLSLHRPCRGNGQPNCR